MNETEVAEAIALQEEHIKRSTSCMRQVGRPHIWRMFGDPATKEQYERCLSCGVPRKPHGGTA